MVSASALHRGVVSEEARAELLGQSFEGRERELACAFLVAGGSERRGAEELGPEVAPAPVPLVQGRERPRRAGADLVEEAQQPLAGEGRRRMARGAGARA